MSELEKLRASIDKLREALILLLDQGLYQETQQVTDILQRLDTLYREKQQEEIRQRDFIQKNLGYGI